MKGSLYRDRDYAFGQAMLTLRTVLRLTQTELADLLGVTRRAVGDWEAGLTYPKAEHLKQFVVLAVERQTFPVGREAEEVRTLWQAARQKVLLDEAWFAALLPDAEAPSAPQPVEETSGSTTGLAPLDGEGPRVDWGDAPAVTTFYGRAWELHLLTSWVVEERCRVVSVLGLGGIGKSALSTRMMHRVAEHFEVVIWRSVREAPTCEGLLGECLQVLVPQALRDVSVSLEQRLGLLLESLRATRVLLVLDNLEALLEEGQSMGHMRAGYEGYAQLLRRMAEDATRAVAISRDGRYWAAGSWRGKVQVWQQGGKILHLAWQAHISTVSTLAFSPDGRALATGSWDGALKLWDVESGDLLWTNWRTNNIQTLAFAPDGHLLASGGNDATVQLWDAHRGTHHQALPGQSGAVYALAWSPDGRLLASGGLDGGIRLWEVWGTQPEAFARMFTGHTDWVFALAFAPDGRRLASGSFDRTVKLWDVESGRVRETLTGHTDKVRAIAWSPDGRILASCGFDQMIWLWDVEGGSYRMTLQGHTAAVHGLAFTPDSRSLLSGSDDGTLRVLEVASGLCVHILQGYTVSLYDVAWSPDGTRLASGGGGQGSGEIVIWDAYSGERLSILSERGGITYALAWDPSGGVLISGGGDGALRWWEV
jgi:WD40 repeat protein/transcriptional regulator with XRE-family HTH domain